MPQLDELDDDELGRATIYARVSPEHKLRLVRALQARGEVVAVTGDGVNDAPALRQADIGVAMGRGGTAAAKDAADMVLADDDFSTLRAAIEEGRRVYDNLVKALAFVLPTSVGQALIIAVAVLAFPAAAVRPCCPSSRSRSCGSTSSWRSRSRSRSPSRPPSPTSCADRRATAPRRCSTARCSSARSRWPTTLTAVALGLFPLARHEGLSIAHAQTTAVTGAVLLQAAVPARLPLAHAAQPRARPLEQPVRLRRHRGRAGAAGAVRLRPVHAHGLRLRRARRHASSHGQPQRRCSSCR